MPNYQIDYQMITDFQVVVEADSWDDAEALLLNDEISEFEPEALMTDLNYDNYEVSEITP